MSKIKIAKALTAATGKPEESYACVQALEEDERARKVEQDRVINQMRQDELQRKAEQDRVINQMRQDELQRKAEQDRIIDQMRQDELQRKADNEKLVIRLEKNNEKFIEQHRADYKKFMDDVQHELSFLRRAIYWATAFLGLAMVVLSVTVALFGGG